MLKILAELADNLDKEELYNQADYIDSMLRKLSGERREAPPNPRPIPASPEVIELLRHMSIFDEPTKVVEKNLLELVKQKSIREADLIDALDRTLGSIRTDIMQALVEKEPDSGWQQGSYRDYLSQLVDGSPELEGTEYEGNGWELPEDFEEDKLGEQ